MKEWLILILTVLVVIAGAFLPEILLSSSQPEVLLQNQQVNITSESSSDYAWRMERLSEHYFGEGEHLLMTYISEEEGGEGCAQFLAAIGQLAAQGIVPEKVAALAEACTGSRVRYYYLFDSEIVSGFRMAEFIASDREGEVHASMDVESGKLAKLEYSGSRLIPEKQAVPETSWYDVLRDYAGYLGLNAPPMAPAELPDRLSSGDASARKYYDSCTAERWSARVSGQNSAWMELRVLRENYKLTIAVYDGGK